ncbi:hypothetical protein OMR07_25235, partial [Methylobacterium organophilum]|nr:hypothetical protein [Methylobacterium organophilum]
MGDAATRPAEFWDTVGGLVTAKVEPVIGRADKQRSPVIDYLRDLEALAQREAVRAYLNGGNWHIITEHQEVESGRNDARPALDAALADA